MKFLTYVDEFKHPLFESRHEINKKELFLAPSVVVFRDVAHARAVLGPFIDQFCLLVLTLDQQEYAQIGSNAWALAVETLLNLPAPTQTLFMSCLLKSLHHMSVINDDRDSLALELKNFKEQFQELNNDFLVITKKMENDNKRKLSQKDALIYASQKIGKVGGFEINLITERTESTPFLLEMLGIEEFNPLAPEFPLHPDARKKFHKAIEQIKAGSNAESFEIECSDGLRRKIFQIDLVPLKNNDGRVPIVQGSMNDISLLKNLEKENEKQKAIAVAASKLASLGEMAGGIAHEINNPVAIIIGLLFKMKHRFEANKLDADEFYSLFDNVQKSIKRITYIIAGLRNFSRDGSKDHMEMRSVLSILEETLAFCEAKLEKNGIRLDYSGIPRDLHMLCRPTEISQVFLNLINNAHDAILEQDEKWIRFEARKGQGFIEISVTDSGKGIDPAIADKIMNPFFTTKELGKGTGLGLSISHGIAERHNGNLYVNPEGEHTQFVLLIPSGN